MWLRRPLVGKEGDENKMDELVDRMKRALRRGESGDGRGKLEERWGGMEEGKKDETASRQEIGDVGGRIGTSLAGREVEERSWQEAVELAKERAMKYAILLRWHPKLVRFTEDVRGEIH